MSTKLFEPQYNISLDAERQGAYDKLKTICENGFISVRDFDRNPLWIFAAHDMVAPICGSTATKMTVQFNLFGGTLLSIGTEKHHKMMDDIDNFSKVGCFGLSELGYGNNAVKMETRIDYNPADECFTINTPHPMAQKYRRRLELIRIWDNKVKFVISKCLLSIKITNARPSFLKITSEFLQTTKKITFHKK